MTLKKAVSEGLLPFVFNEGLLLAGKKILLGITGGIAAYKCPHLVRLLIRQGAEVKVVMSPAAGQFVTPNTLSVLSKNEVLTDFFDANHNWNNHVKLAEWADLLLIAPLTANTLAAMASGLCDNLLLACYLSARSKTIVAPAMDLDMYRHPTVSANISKLQSFGNLVIPPESGELASGLHGEGRMAEPENIVAFVNSHFATALPLRGRRAVVNAGPTYEAIDPVRFIGNRSSGKMGIAIAEELARRGATVHLVLGPSHETISSALGTVQRVESSGEMAEATLSAARGADIVVCAAAVADYRPATSSEQKLKKTGHDLRLDLVETRDILSELGREKSFVLVGFALETSNLEENARKKLLAKNADMIVANAASGSNGAVFGSESNTISILTRDNKITNFELKSKQEAAADIVNAIIALLSAKQK